MNGRQPSCDVSRMPRELAARHFAARLEKLKDDIRSLPTVEKIRLAADMLDAAVDASLVASVLQLALAEVRCPGRGDHGRGGGK